MIMDNIDEFLNRVISGQDTEADDINISVALSNDGTQYLTEGAILCNYEQRGNDSSKK